MTPPPAAAASPAIGAAPPRSSDWVNIAAIVALGLIVGLACRGHFAMPYSDFFEFVDVGHALLAGELPPTMKRPPVYPVAVVGAAELLRAAGTGLECPEQTVAEWFNALLLPLNAVLIYLLLRPAIGGAARWPAAWFVMLPLSAYCTAHLVVEPLTATAMLATAVAAMRGGTWMYVLAGLTPLVRFDAAGVIVGVVIADLLRRRRHVGLTLLRGLAALVPLMIWLVLTAATWSLTSDDHYLTRMAAAPTFDVWRPMAMFAQAALPPNLVDRLTLDALPIATIQMGIAIIVWLLAAVGALLALRRREFGGVVVAAAMLGYVAVHTVLPFAVDRYAYPPAPLLVVLAVGGCGAPFRNIRAWRPLGAVGVLRTLILITLGVACTVGIASRAEIWAARADAAARFGARVGVLGLLGIAAVWALPRIARRRRLSAMVGLLGAAFMAVELAGQDAALLGRGDEMRNVVEAARWLRDNAPPGVRVLSDNPGLLRAYVGREPRDRFMNFAAIKAADWPAIVEECRAQGIRYIVWHDEMRNIHGGHYGEAWRIERFYGLDAPTPPDGVAVVRRFAKRPELAIYEVPIANSE